MIVREVISAVDALKPNGYTVGQKTAWIEDMENELWRDVFLRTEMPGAGGEGSERTLMLPDAWRRLYHMYLAAMIDFSNAEYTKYSNAMAAYNSAAAAFAAWYAGRFAPADRAAYWAKAADAAYNGAGSFSLTLPRGAAVIAAVCQVDTAFDGGSGALTLGTAAHPAALMGEGDVTAQWCGRYFVRTLFLPEENDRQLCAGYDGEAAEGAAQFAVLIQPGKE